MHSRAWACWTRSCRSATWQRRLIWRDAGGAPATALDLGESFSGHIRTPIRGHARGDLLDVLRERHEVRTRRRSSWKPSREVVDVEEHEQGVQAISRRRARGARPAGWRGRGCGQGGESRVRKLVHDDGEPLGDGADDVPRQVPVNPASWGRGRAQRRRTVQQRACARPQCNETAQAGSCSTKSRCFAATATDRTPTTGGRRTSWTRASPSAARQCRPASRASAATAGGRCTIASRSRTGAADGSRYSGTPRTRCCSTSRKVHAKRSKMQWC